MNWGLFAGIIVTLAAIFGIIALAMQGVPLPGDPADDDHEAQGRNAGGNK